MTTTCVCGAALGGARADAAYCSNACRQRAYRGRSRNGASPRDPSRNTTGDTASRNTPSLAPDDANRSRNADRALRHLDKAVAALEKAREIMRSGNCADPPEVLQGWMSAIRKEADQMDIS